MTSSNELGRYYVAGKSPSPTLLPLCRSMKCWLLLCLYGIWFSFNSFYASKKVYFIRNKLHTFMFFWEFILYFHGWYFISSWVQTYIFRCEQVLMFVSIVLVPVSYKHLEAVLYTYCVTGYRIPSVQNCRLERSNWMHVVCFIELGVKCMLLFFSEFISSEMPIPVALTVWTAVICPQWVAVVSIT